MTSDPSTQPVLVESAVYLDLAERMGEGVAIMSRDGSFKFTNSTCRRILNATTEQILGRAPLDPGAVVLGSDGVPLKRDQLPSARVFATGKPIYHEVMSLARRNEAPLWIRINVIPFPGNDEPPTHVIITFNEDTRQHEIEDRLRRQSEYFRRTSDGVVVFSPLGRILEWSEGARRLFGFEAREVLGERVNKLHEAIELHRLRGDIAAALVQREDWKGESVFLRKDGRQGLAEVEIFPVINATGALTEIHCIYHDLTPQRDAMMAASLRARYLEAISEGATAILKSSSRRESYDEFVALMGPVSGASRCYIFENSYDEQGAWYLSQKAEWCAPGITAQIGNPDLQQLPYDPLFTDLKEKFRRREFVSWIVSELAPEVREILEPQGIRALLMLPIFSRDRCVGFIGFDNCADESLWRPDQITLLRAAATTLSQACERWEAEELRARLEVQLRQSYKMEALGRMSGGIAHDFNNLLAAILGYVEDLEVRLKEDSGCIRDLQEIRQAARRGAKLVDQLMTFSRRRRGDSKVVHLPDVLSNLLPMLHRLAGPGVSFHFTATPGLFPVRFDGGQFEQIVTNLTLNSRDAMGEKGRITMRLENVDHTNPASIGGLQIAPGHFVEFIHSDTGMGLSDEVRERLFEPFFTTKDVGKGTGVGLSVVYGLVTQSGGHIEAYNVPGGGCEFRILLPAQSDNLHRNHSASESDNMRRYTLVLVCDHDQERRQRLGEALHEQEFTVYLCSTFAELHGMLEDVEHPPTLILLGSVPDLRSGTAAWRELVALDQKIAILGVGTEAGALLQKLPQKGLPRPVLTSNAGPADILQALIEIQTRTNHP